MRLACCRLLLALSLAARFADSSAIAATAAPRALFDNAHGEQAGNADWVIDDQQPEPRPAQSGVGASTPDTYWLGGISTWGVELVKRGFRVTTNNVPFTFGNSRNPLDLSHFDVVIVPEPNRPFSPAEATALLAFVRAGGGLVAVADHDRSDRDRDGFDSPRVWNTFDPAHALGVHWGSKDDADANITQRSSNVADPGESDLVKGAAGTVAGLEFHNGTTLTLDRAANPTVRGGVWMNGAPRTSPSGVMAAQASYGKGRVAFIGDSSVIDDGSANPGNTSIYDGWDEAGGSNGILAMNATLWVTRRH